MEVVRLEKPLKSVQTRLELGKPSFGIVTGTLRYYNEKREELHVPKEDQHYKAILIDRVFVSDFYNELEL